MTDICLIHPEYCEVGAKFTEAFGGSRTHKNETSVVAQPELGVPSRHFGVRETEVPQRRFGVRELPQPPIRRFGVREEVPTPRRFGVRETEPTKSFGRHIRSQASAEPPALLKGLSKKYNKKLEAFKEKQLKNLKLGVQESFETIEQHKYARLAQGAYDYSYKSKAKALAGLKKTGQYIPELNDFEIIPEYSNNNFTAYKNRVTGERHFAVRGSDTKFLKPDKNVESMLRGKGLRAKRGFQDWVTNLKFAIGKHHNSTRYTEGNNLLKEFAGSEGLEIKDITLSGHSLGGGLAKWLSRKYGGTAFVFNPAANPIKKFKMKSADFHSDSFVKAYRTFGDGVSLAEVTAKEPQMEITNLTSMPGHETSILAQHGLEEQFLPEPADVQVSPETPGKIKLHRTTKFRNISGITAGTAAEIGIKNALMAIPAVLLEPEYASAAEKDYRRTETAVDIARTMFEFEGGDIFKRAVGGGGLPLDVPGVGLQAIVGDLLGSEIDRDDPHSVSYKYHAFMKKVREPIFGADPDTEPRFEAPPGIISDFNKLFSHQRYDADKEKSKIQDMADAYGISYEEAFQMTPETDTGMPTLATGDNWQERLDAAAERGGLNRDTTNSTSPDRELKSYEWRDPETGRIYVDEYLFESFKREQAGQARWDASQAEIRAAQAAQSYATNYQEPTYSSGRRNITEI